VEGQGLEAGLGVSGAGRGRERDGWEDERISEVRLFGIEDPAGELAEAIFGGEGIESMPIEMENGESEAGPIFGEERGDLRWGASVGFPIDVAWRFAEIPSAEACEVIAGGGGGV